MSGAPAAATTAPATTTAPPPAPAPNGLGAPPATTTAPANDWTSSLTPELKQIIDVKGYKTPADVVQAYANAQKAIGADKIMLPDKEGNWNEEARTKLGVPKDATGYQITRPEGLPPGLQYDEAFEKAALPVAHKIGLTPYQVNELIKFYAGYQGDVFKQASVDMTNNQNLAGAQLKKEWGTAYDANLQKARVAAKFFGGDALVNFFNSSGIGDSPELIRAFAKIGAQMTEDQLKVGSGSGFGMTPEEAQREINKLMAHPGYSDRNHPEHKDIVEKVQALFRQKHPE